MALSDGAVRLPMSHLSVRVAWHDTDWTGRICAVPGANHACTILKNVKESKDADLEERSAGKAWSSLTADVLPPCVFERAGFMRPEAFTVLRKHAYAGDWNKSHAHFAETPHRMPAYSFEATPYRWMMRAAAKELAASWGMTYDQTLEDRADGFMNFDKPAIWVQDHRNQLALLDSFYSAIVPGESLVLVYAKDVPLLEERPAGARVLVGAGRIADVGPSQEWSYKGTGPLRSVMWERAVHHTVRPGFVDGFLLPYQQILANPDLAGEDLGRYVAHAPPESWGEFSYVTEHVGSDGAIASLLELYRVVELLPGVAGGRWDIVASWISDRLADVWRLRGPYPGLGAALTAAGIERGALVAHRVIESLPDPSADPWPAVGDAIPAATEGRGPAAGLVGRMGRRAWERISASPERMGLLRLVARFPLTVDQARRMFDQGSRSEAGISTTDAALLANPYLVYELDRGRLDAVTFRVIDRGLFPQDASAQAALVKNPLPDPVAESGDDRRVRAACAALLEDATDEGHTLLDEARLRRRLGMLELDPKCDPAADLYDLATETFDPFIRAVDLAGGGRGWQLDRLADAASVIRDAVSTRIRSGPIQIEWDWRARIDEVLDEPAEAGDALEEAARTEKAEALKILARSRVAALVGLAGTGKTTMLRARCTHSDTASRGVLLLAPTGKARVQLADKVGAQARTIAQFLRPSGRWDGQTRAYRLRPDEPPAGQWDTVVIDESSMLTEEMLAATLDALPDVKRLVLCGDHRQLPPIGAGRPFADLVKYLRDDVGEGLAELTVGRRQDALEGVSALTGRDDLAVASWFSVDGSSPAADEAFGRVTANGGDGTLKVISWDNDDDLERVLVEVLRDDIGILLGDADELKRSLGALGTYNGRASFDWGEGGSHAEDWQILTPVRSRPGGVMPLNRLVRRTWRSGHTTMARKSRNLPPPLGTDEILFHDKVMCVSNHPRPAYRPTDRAEQRGEVANGEIGMAVSGARQRKDRKPNGLRVEFSTQPGLQYTFWDWQLESEDRDILELAYAVTIHKAQGSQFGVTVVVVPNPCPLLSPELLYTALTRQRQAVLLLVQGDPSDLRRYVGPAASVTLRRLTNLFRKPDPVEVGEGVFLDAAHAHRTANGEFVISKSEVIVANTLRSLGVRYTYELPLNMPDGSWRLPDFTVKRSDGDVYWEHVGMLSDPGYQRDWDDKRAWYASHGILPWSGGGGPNGTLVWSTESRERGIDAQGIERLAKDVFTVG